MIDQVKIPVTTKDGCTYLIPYDLSYEEGRIFFKEAKAVQFKFKMLAKDEIKAMQGARWHGHIPDDGRKMWSVAECTRNNFQLDFMSGGNPYANWDQPLTQWGFSRPLYEHQKLMANHCLTYHYQLLAAEMGVGKGGRTSTNVLTPSGWTTMGQLEVGSRLVDPDGGECEVVSLHPRGRMEIFKVTFTDGSSCECTGDHFWRVITPNWKHRGQGYQVRELKDLVASGLQIANGNNKYFVPMVEPVHFDARPIACHPYVLGYLLGNGHMPQYGVSIPDEETVDRLNSFMSCPLKPKMSTERGESIDYIITCPIVKSAIRQYNLRSCLSDTKFVPEDYLFNTIESRRYLLQGLLDSDGGPTQSATVEYSTASPDLADAVVFLVQSLGCTCNRPLKEEPIYTYKGETQVGKPSHRLHISFNSKVPPFLLSRKAALFTAPTKYEPTRAIVSVESVGFDEAICIKVSSDTHCYVTDEFIVTHNTLSAIEVMEQSGVLDWWYVAPKSGLAAVEREFKKWDLKIMPKFLTYDRLRIDIERWEPGMPAPQGVIFDESSRLKTASAKRTKAAQHLADAIRAEHGWAGYVILMTGTPAPKSPVDWWPQCEVCYPGFLKEGSQKAFEWRLGIFQKEQTDQGEFWKRVSWRDDEHKCNKCGEYADHANHNEDDLFGAGDKAHAFVPSKNEVAYIYERLDGLVLPLAKRDCLDIPEKIYREVVLEPTSTLKRVAKALAKSAMSAIQGLTWLRELSDGFQYREKQDGMEKCPVCDGKGECDQWFFEGEDEPVTGLNISDDNIDEYEQRMAVCPKCEGAKEIPHMVRETKEIKSPKDNAVRDLLEENEDQGRFVIFTGFQGSNDRVTKICHKLQWDVVQVDGRGWKILKCDGEKAPRDVKPLDYWCDLENNNRVVFVAHPMSGGMGLTLTESRMALFYSNDFNPESRRQAEDRIHRPGIDKNRGATIVDLFHLGTDRKVLSVLRDNGRLEKMSLGELQEALEE